MNADTRRCVPKLNRRRAEIAASFLQESNCALPSNFGERCASLFSRWTRSSACSARSRPITTKMGSESFLISETRIMKNTPTPFTHGRAGGPARFSIGGAARTVRTGGHARCCHCAAQPRGRQLSALAASAGDVSEGGNRALAGNARGILGDHEVRGGAHGRGAQGYRHRSALERGRRWASCKA